MNFTTLLKFGEGIDGSPIGDRVAFGLQVVGIGMGVVFGVLLILMFVLQLFKLIFASQKNDKKSKTVSSENTAAPAPATSVPVNAVNDSEEEKIVAIATAAIAASRGQSEVNFKVLSISPINGQKTVAPQPASVAATAPVAAPAPEAKPAPAAAPAPAATPADGVKVNAPLPGTVLDVKVSAGATVKSGDILCVLEAMKMENEIVAPQDGTIASVVATKGSSVNTGDLLFVIG